MLRCHNEYVGYCRFCFLNSSIISGKQTAVYWLAFSVLRSPKTAVPSWQIYQKWSNHFFFQVLCAQTIFVRFCWFRITQKSDRCFVLASLEWHKSKFCHLLHAVSYHTKLVLRRKLQLNCAESNAHVLKKNIQMIM